MTVLDAGSRPLSVLEQELATGLVALMRAEVEVDPAGLHRRQPAPEPVLEPVPEPVPAPVLTADVMALAAAVEAVLAQDPVGLPAPVAVERAAALLALSERLQAGLLAAVADVDSRELFAQASAGSTRSWLRQSVTGDRGQLALARRLRRHGQVAAALAAGRVGVAAATEVCVTLERVPEQLPEHQMNGVLAHGLPDTLDAAAGGPLTADRRTPAQQALAAELDQVVAAALQDVSAAPAQRLEPAFVLLAAALPPSQLGAALDRLVDALQPEAVADREQHTDDARSWRLVKKRFTRGYRLEADLTDEDGLILAAEMHSREAAIDAAAAALARAAAHAHEGAAAHDHEAAADPDDAGPDDAGADDADSDVDHHDADEPAVAQHDQAPPESDPPTGSAQHTAPPRGNDPRNDTDARADADTDTDAVTGAGAEVFFGAAGPGRAPQKGLPPPWDRAPDSGSPPVDRGGPPTTQLLRYQAFMALIRDAAASRGHGRGALHPFAFTITTTLDALHGVAGVLPGTLNGPDGPLPLSTAALRRLGCGSPLSAVLLDAAGNPLGASGTHRHATARERRALHARQGLLCGINACPNPWTIPHHVEPWWKTRRTTLKDLLGVCDWCHHDVHDGHRTLLLRDGRLINENGWIPDQQP